MKKNFKRWLALLLAVVMVATSAVYSSGTSLLATSEDTVGQEDLQAGPPTADEGAGEANVETNDSDAGTQGTGETGSTATQEIVLGEQPKVSDAEEQSNPNDQTAEVTPSENVEQEYNVVFHKPAVEGGSIKIWTDGSEKRDVTYEEDGKYTEGDLLNAEVTVDGKHTVDMVKDQNGNVIAPVAVNRNVFTYQIEVSENKEITAVYKEVSQDTPEKDNSETTVSEEPSVPITGSLTNGGVTVNVNAPEGTFPNGTTLDIKPVNSSKIDNAISDVVGEGKEVNGTVAFDITFYDKSGNEIQPAEGHQVAVDFTVSASSSLTNGEDSKLQVFHMEDERSAADPVSTTVAANNSSDTTVSVNADSFSIYVVGAVGTPYITTYNFFDINGSQIANATQIVKSNEIVSEPEVPAVTGKVFSGWYTAQTGGNKFTFGNVGTLTADKTVNLYAQYRTEWHVYYKDGDGKIVYTQTYANGDRLDYTNVQFAVRPDEAITGWYVTNINTPVSNGIAVTADMTLNPIIKRGYWLKFDTDGGSYIDPQFVAAGQKTVKPEDPKKPGYTFKNWTLNSSAFSFGNALSADTTIKATWTAQKVGYTVVYWKQKITDNKNATDSQKTYDYDSSDITRTANVGATVSANSTDTGKSWEGFKYNGSKSTSVTVKADGTTVLNVYYDRQLMTMNFYRSTGKDWWGNTIWESNPSIVFTGLYGSSLEANGYTWPNTFGWNYQNGSSTTYMTFLDAFIFPISGTTINFKQTSLNSGSTISHYKQQLDGTYSAQAANTTSASGNGSFTFTNKYNGFTISEYSTDGRTWRNASAGGSVSLSNSNLRVRYTRNSYNFAYYNYNKVEKQDSVKYEEPLNSKAGYVPPRPSGLADYYTFDGWYADASLTQEYDFSGVMPAAGVTIYAKWIAPEFTVEFYTDTDIPFGTQQTIKAGEKVTALEPPTMAGKIFAGWVKEDGTPFSFDQQIISNMKIYATWVGGPSYQVKYNAGRGSGTVPVDSNTYTDGAKAPAALNNGLTAPTGEVFIGWKSSSDNKVYYPGSLVQISNANVTLTAQWAKKAATTKLIYDYNGGIDSNNNTQSSVITSLENSRITAAANGSTRTGYTFDSWNTKADGTGTKVQPGSTIQIDNLEQYTADTNILYATWKENKVDIQYISENTAAGTVSPAKDSVLAVTGNLSGTRSTAAAADGYYFTGWTLQGSQQVISTDKELSAAVINNYAKVNGLYAAATFVAHFKSKTPITVTADSAEKYYDGTALTASGYSVTPESALAEGDSLIATISGSITNAGTSANTVSSVKIIHDNGDGTTTDVTGKYTINKQDGMLTVKRVVVTITADNKAKQYGLNNPSLTYQVSGLVNNETLDSIHVAPELSTTAGKVSPAGDYPITFKPESAVSQTTNYDITYVPGTLKIVKNVTPLIITAKDAQQVYNGEALKASGYKSVSGLTAGDTISMILMKDTSQITDVGSKANEIASVMITNESGQIVNVTDNYENIIYVPGTLQVTPAVIEVKAVDNGKGLGQTDPSLTYQVTKDSNINGETAAFTGNVSRESGETAKTYEIRQGTLNLADNGAFKASNYTLNFIPGTFTIESPDFSITKSLTNEGTGENGAFKAGETAKFDITVTNNSKFDIENVTVSDILNGGTGAVQIVANGNAYSINENGTAEIAKLAKGEDVVVKAEYTVTQADVDAQGTITNTATVKAPDTDPTESGEVTVPVEKVKPAVTVTKKITEGTSGNGADGTYKAGDVAHYTITVTNTGNVTLENIPVNETLPGATFDTTGTDTASIAKLAPQESAALAASYTVTQADVDKGEVINNVATAKAPGTEEPTPSEPTPITPEKKNPEVTVTKKITEGTAGTGLNGTYKAGEVVHYTITVTNTGNVTLEDIPVNETLAGATFDTTGTDTASIAKLEPQESASLAASYKVTQADVNKGEVINNIATATAPGTEEPTPSNPTPTYPEPKNPAVTVKKEITQGTGGTGEDGTYKAGEVAHYTITVTNNGNVTLENIPVEETLPGATFDTTGTAAESIDKLEPQQSVTLAASYTVTQTDVNKGEVINNIAAATVPGTTNPVPSNPTPVTPETKNPALTVAKAVKEGTKGTGENGTYKAGDVAQYTITVTNSGNVTLENIPVNETLIGATFDSTNAAEAIIAKLEPKESTTLAASYTVTQADVDKGEEINNVATATVPGTEEPTPSEPTPITPEDKKPEVTVTKEITAGTSGTGENGTYKAGEVAHYTITVTNSGNVTLENIPVNEMLTGATFDSTNSAEAVIAELRPTESTTLAASYTVTQADVDKGEVINNIATATAPGTEEPTPSEPTPITPEDKSPEVTVTKEITEGTAGTGENGTYKAGDVAHYTITVTNSGNVTLENIPVNETLAGATFDSTNSAEAVIEKLEPKESTTLAASYTVTQADVDKGEVINNVATATAPGTEEPTPSEPTPITPEDKNPEVTVTKKVTAGTEGTGENGTYKAGDVAHYTITVTNSGNVTLENIPVNETLTGATFDSTNSAEAVIEKLEPKESTTLAASYTVTQADVDRGEVINNVATATAPGTEEPTPSEPTPITPEDKNPEVTVAKEVTAGTSGTGENGTYKAGEVAHYTITVTNSGNVTLENIPVNETLTGATFDSTNSAEAVIEKLEPKESKTLAASYTVTQADVDKGEVINNIATATAPGTEEPTPSEPTPITPETKAPAFTAVKAVSNNGTGENGAFKAGETATFTITVKNTGNTTLKNIKVADELEGAVITSGTGYTVEENGSAVITSMAPNTSTVVYAQYKVTQEDVDNGGVKNVAAVTVPGENQPQNPSVDVPTDTQKPEIVTSKEVTNQGTGEEGAFKADDTAIFEIKVTNVGNVTQRNITVEEGLSGAVILPGSGYTVENGVAKIDRLTVGTTVTVNAEYTVTQADIDNGEGLMNVAIVKADETDPQNPETPIPVETKNPSMNVTKSILDEQELYHIGDTIQYQIKVANDGNTTLNNLVISDQLSNASGNVVFAEGDGYTVDGSTVLIGQLAPGKSVTINCSYEVTRADSGKTITNTATGTSDETPEPEEGTTGGIPVERLYTLTIHYVYSGTSATAAPDYTGEFAVGEAFSVQSPAIDGYTMDYASISSGENGMPADDLEFTVTYKPLRNVNYSWSGLPEGTTLYDGPGNVVVPVLPASLTGLRNGQEYIIDNEMPKVVYTHDAYGNINQSYTLSKWNDPNNGIMGDDDVTVTGVWAAGNVEVNTWNITYQWSGDIPGGAYAQTLPTDTKAYINNAPYEVDNKFSNGYTVTTHDAYGNVNGAYTFGGWDTKPGSSITSDMTIRGTWSFTETAVASHNIIYSWSGLPEGTTLYDEAGNVIVPGLPASITGLVNGQEYTIDNEMPATVVYTHDANGNRNGSYTFGEWNDPNSGIMGDSDVTVTGVWTGEEIEVPVTPTEPTIPTTPTTPTPPVTPVTPVTPAAPAAPAVPTPGALIPAAPTVVIPPTQTPAGAIDAEVTENEDGSYELTPIEDTETPLANTDLDDHACCILHFLLMLLALLILILYTKSMKKRQARIFELREELELKKARNGLGGEE